MTTLRPRRNAPSCKPRLTERLTIEQLEQRELFAGDVSAVMQGDMLVISGDAEANAVELRYYSNAQTYRVISGVSLVGSPTTINGLDATQAPLGVGFGGVTAIYIGLGAGDDELMVGSPEAVDTVIQKWLTIDMGDGDDIVVLAGNFPAGSGAGIPSLNVGTSLNINLGAGNDGLIMANTTAGYALNIDGGDGDDRVKFDTRGGFFCGSSGFGCIVSPVVVHGNAQINLGGGADELTMENVSVQGNLRILDGAGAADLTLTNVNVKKRIDINTGSDADQINLQSVRAKQLNMNTNGGIDDVHLSNCKFTTLNLKLGAGRDHLMIEHTRSSLFSHIDGEAQGSQFINRANSLHRMWRRHLG